MRRFFMICASIAVFAAATTAAWATVAVDIDRSRQTMHVNSAGGSYEWPISSARSGFYTPGGSYAPTHMEVMHYSHKYHMSPMPYAIFFRGGYAIHGTYSTASLGHPASHGCVRLAPGNAARLFGLVKAEGARISISGSPPASTPFARSEDTHSRRRYAERQTDEQAYSDAPAGYHFIGRRDGHRLYQADTVQTQTGFGFFQ